MAPTLRGVGNKQYFITTQLGLNTRALIRARCNEPISAVAQVYHGAWSRAEVLSGGSILIAKTDGHKAAKLRSNTNALTPDDCEHARATLLFINLLELGKQIWFQAVESLNSSLPSDCSGVDTSDNAR